MTLQERIKGLTPDEARARDYVEVLRPVERWERETIHAATLTLAATDFVWVRTSGKVAVWRHRSEVKTFAASRRELRESQMVGRVKE